MKDISFNLSGKIEPFLVEVLSLVSREAMGLDIPLYLDNIHAGIILEKEV
jgi:hypothetical protein